MLPNTTPFSSASRSVRNSFTLAGTPAFLTVWKKSKSMGKPRGKPGLTPVSAAALLHEDELLEEVDVLLVLEQRAVERRDGGLVALAPQGLRRDVLGEQQLQPVEQLRRRGLLLESRHLADVEEGLERRLQQ